MYPHSRQQKLDTPFITAHKYDQNIINLMVLLLLMLLLLLFLLVLLQSVTSTHRTDVVNTQF